MLLLPALLATGCESVSSGTTSVACEESPGAAGHLCATFSGPGLAMACGAGAMVPNCPTAGVLGTCSYTLSAGGISEDVSITYYSDGMVTAATAEMECSATSGAIWTAQ